MSDERLFPRAIAKAAYEHVVNSNRGTRWAWQNPTGDQQLEEDLRELVESYDRPG